MNMLDKAKELMSSKRHGNVNSLNQWFLGLLTFGFLGGVGFIVLQQFLNQTTSGTLAYQFINTTMYALIGFATWLQTIVTAVAGGIVIALVIGAVGYAYQAYQNS